MIMPFGKHKGEELDEIPRGYLQWLSTQDWLGGWLAHAVGETLAGRPIDEPVRQKTADELVHEIVQPREGARDEAVRTFSVRPSGHVGQENLDADGRIIAWTTDEWAAQVIRKLLAENQELLVRP